MEFSCRQKLIVNKNQKVVGVVSCIKNAKNLPQKKFINPVEDSRIWNNM